MKIQRAKLVNWLDILGFTLLKIMPLGRFRQIRRV
jgi:hypothetical protein